MKKTISIFLALAMIMSLSITAFAAEGDQTSVGTGAYSTNVIGSYVPGTEASGIVFSVDISWTAMSFTYHAEKAPVWNAKDHEYSTSTPAKWEGATEGSEAKGTITITNHSNTKITAKPAYTPGDNYGNARMVFSTDLLRVASAVETNTEQVGTITVTPTGYLPKMDAAATIGSITVTIAQDKDVTIEEAEALYNEADNFEADWDPDESDTVGKNLDYELAACNSDLAGEIGMFKNAGQGSQERLNRYYEQALNAYNAAKAHYDSL